MKLQKWLSSFKLKIVEALHIKKVFHTSVKPHHTSVGKSCKCSNENFLPFAFYHRRKYFHPTGLHSSENLLKVEEAIYFCLDS